VIGIVACLEAGALLAVVTAADLASAPPIPDGWPAVARAASRTLALAFCWLAALYYNGLYEPAAIGDPKASLRRLPRAFLTALALLGCISLLVPQARMAAASLVPGLAGATLALLLIRAAAHAIVRSRAFAERILILGTSPLAEKLVREMERRRDGRRVLVGIVADAASAGGSSFPYPVLAPFDHLGRILDGVRPDRVVVAMRERRGRLALKFLMEARLLGIAVEDAAEFYERLTGKIAIESLTPSGLIFSRGFRHLRWARSAGRALSLLAALVVLVLGAPLGLLIALLIALDSRGPLLFVQERVGLDGRRFRMYKFRTMHPSGEPESEWARDNDHRITRVGRWLREFRLDELPQFVNILRGDMNLVGPRPHPVSNYDLFLERVPYYALRSGVRPGVTGWAQIRYGYANNLEEETEKMRYDLHYIKHQSPGLDLRILLDTVKIVLLGRGSERIGDRGTEPAPGEPRLPAPLRARQR
jgi:exopolysaccharide biosynthesis polyprenyl glycosylphosphotransferase